VPATVLDTELPPGLDYIIARAIAKDPSQRYQRGIEMVRDIQDLQQGREPWSKTEQPDSAGRTPPSASETARLASLGPLAAAANRRANRQALTAQRGVAENLLARLRKTSFAGALLMVGLFIFGLRLEHLTSRQEALPSAATKATTPPAATADAVPLKANSEPIAKKHRKHVPTGGSHASPPEAPSAASSIPSASPIPPAMLEIEVDHKFADARMSIWVDDLLTYSHSLEGIDKKHLVVFHTVQGHEFHAVQISPGKHLLRVQVTSGADQSERSATIDGDFVSGTEKMLRVLFSKSGGMNLNLQ